MSPTATAMLPALLPLLLLSVPQLAAAEASPQPIRGTHCSPNQVITKLTVYEDGAIEAECNKLPCGVSGTQCIENQSNCKAETDVFSGMKWAVNGQSVLLRCCTLKVPERIYVGTDLVSLGSYYTGGLVDKKDLYGKGGPEFDFISNIRTEQGGVRVWVYRVMCPLRKPVEQETADTQPRMQMDTFSQHADPAVSASRDGVPERVAASQSSRPQNPLQYRPAHLQQRDHPISTVSESAAERLI